MVSDEQSLSFDRHPAARDSFALGLRALLSEYSLRMNTLRGEIRGHAWQSRFYSCALRRRHLWMALRYVELNPVRANLVEKPEEYAWSSAQLSLGLAPHTAVAWPSRDTGRPAEWAMWLHAGASPTRKSDYVNAPFRDGHSVPQLRHAAGPEKRDGA